ncbi:MAG: Rieske 2Fe-2S domain-containing protein [Acidobacteriota bacterium]
MSAEPTDRPDDPTTTPERRTFLKRLASLLVGGGLVAAYGTLAGFFARFLYPARGDRGSWMFVRQISGVGVGDSVAYRLPNGLPISITRRGDSGQAKDFVAFSSTCPHLGCRVHWESHNQRYFCPCHNGVFSPDGRAIAGPPADAGQSLEPYPLEVRDGLLFIQVSLDQVAAKGRSTNRA